MIREAANCCFSTSTEEGGAGDVGLDPQAQLEDRKGIYTLAAFLSKRRVSSEVVKNWN
jgi:hypothetical protein